MDFSISNIANQAYSTVTGALSTIAGQLNPSQWGLTQRVAAAAALCFGLYFVATSLIGLASRDVAKVSVNNGSAGAPPAAKKTDNAAFSALPRPEKSPQAEDRDSIKPDSSSKDGADVAEPSRKRERSDSPSRSESGTPPALEPVGGDAHLDGEARNDSEYDSTEFSSQHTDA